MYKLLPDTVNGPATCIYRIDDNTYIPLDPDNSDYKRYLEWLSEGNTPEPADESQGE